MPEPETPKSATRYVLRVHRLERDGDALLPQHVRAYRFVGPVDVSLRIRFFGQQAIHHSGALGFLVSKTAWTRMPVSYSKSFRMGSEKNDPH